jgi:hypothetical protein
VGTIRPRPRTTQSLASKNAAAQKDREQIRRLLSTQPKPAKPAPVTGGGIVGMAQVASTGGVVFQASVVSMDYTSVTYGSPSDPYAGSGGAGTIDWLTISGYQLFVTAGWYIPVLTMAVLWDDAATAPPAFSGPYMNGGWDSAHNDNGVFPRVTFNTGSGGIQQIANFGPTYMTDGADFHAELRTVGGTATAANNSSPSLSRIVWNITKLG